MIWLLMTLVPVKLASNGKGSTLFGDGQSRSAFTDGPDEGIRSDTQIDPAHEVPRTCDDGVSDKGGVRRAEDDDSPVSRVQDGIRRDEAVPAGDAEAVCPRAIGRRVAARSNVCLRCRVSISA